MAFARSCIHGHCQWSFEGCWWPSTCTHKGIAVATSSLSRFSIQMPGFSTRLPHCEYSDGPNALCLPQHHNCDVFDEDIRRPQRCQTNQYETGSQQIKCIYAGLSFFMQKIWIMKLWKSLLALTRWIQEGKIIINYFTCNFLVVDGLQQYFTVMTQQFLQCNTNSC